MTEVETGAAQRKTVLVVSHEASRTGAPRMAIEVLRALREQGLGRSLVVRWPGPLFDELRTEADCTMVEPLGRLRVELRRRRRSRALAVALEERVAARILKAELPDLVYLNTVKSASYVRPALALGIPVVLHAHETGRLLTDTLSRYHLDGLYEQLTLVACSREVAEGLRHLSGGCDVTVVASAVDATRIRRLAGERDEGGTDEGGPAGTTQLTVVACGTADQRKGVDIWLESAALVAARLRETTPRFIWVGADPGGRCRAQAAAAGLGHVVEFVGEVANPYPLLARADLVTVTSREDPFPLVVLEAMALGRPVVAFDVGGISEQLGPDGGVLVAVGGPADMATAFSEAVIRMLAPDAEEARLALGGAAKRRADTLFGTETFRTSVATIVMPQL